MAVVGSISGKIGHICRYGRHEGDVGRRSALLCQKIGTTRSEDRNISAIFADMADIRPTSAAWRDKSAIFADMADVGSISGQIGHICRYGRHQADVGRRSALLGQKIGTYLPYLPIWPTSAAYRDKSAIFADMSDTRPTSAEDRHSSARRSALISHICRYG